MQDHLAHIQEARQAVNALRDEFETQRQEQLKDEQYRRRIQMQQKLDFMRQKKHVRRILDVLIRHGFGNYSIIL